MKLSKVLIYLIILVALAAYVYFVEIRHKQKLEAEKAEAEKIVKVDKDKVTQIELKSKAHGVIDLKKTDGTWILTRPVTVKADPSAIRSLLNTISDAKYEKVLKEKDVKWDEYGLDKPAFTMSVNTRDDTCSLFFGASNPAKTSYYLRSKGDSKLLLVADTLKNALNKSTFDLRDKTVFALAPEDIDRISISKDGTETQLKKEASDKWMMLKPDQERVKSADVKRDLINLTNLQARDIIDEPKKDGDPYGLDNPTEWIELAGKKRSQTLLIGKAKEAKIKRAASNPDRYARIKGMEMVYVIDGRTLANVKTDPKELQDKYLLHFKPDRIVKLEVVLDGKEWLAARSKDTKWTLEKPELKKDMDAWPITGLLWGLKNLEWKDMTKPAPTDLAGVNLDAPRLVVSLWKKDDKEPMVLKAGWKDSPAEKPEKGSKEASGGAAKDASGPAAAKGGEPPKKVDKPGKTESEAPKPAKLPEKVSVVVQPHDEKNALFTLEGTYIERLRGDLKRLTAEEEK